MSDLLLGLNREQLDVVNHRGHCLALACPGSGKTKTLATKAATFLDAGETVAAVTFTRDAAMELRERIMLIAQPGCKSRLLVGTFHSMALFMAFPKKAGEFGRAILRDAKSPFDKQWSIVNEGIRRGYVMRSIREVGMSIMLDEASAIIEQVKANPTSIDIDDVHRHLTEAYVTLMKEAGQIDFQDIILNTNAALSNKTLDPLNVTHLMVDEFQDTDNAQLEWTMHHGKAGIPITVVGDDDQSIYAFRNALGYQGMDTFAKKFHAVRVLLGTNYRCHSEILSSAEKLIHHNTERMEKVLHAHKGEGGVVGWETFKDDVQEAAAVAVDAKVALDEGATFAVISRTNRQLHAVEAELIKANVPFVKTDGKSIFDCSEIQTFAATLRSIIKPASNDIDQIVGWCGMTEADARAIRRAFGSNIHIGNHQDFKNHGVTKNGVDIWRSFAKKHAEWVEVHAIAERSTGKTAVDMYQLVCSGVKLFLEEFLEKPNSPAILDAAGSMFSFDSGTLQEHLTYLKRQETDMRRDKSDAGENKPNIAFLTTAHGSKGLEFDRVCIVGVNTGVFPSDKSAVEEERRLMYVAMTRAREILSISAIKTKKPSLFAYEAGLIAKL